ncbi:MAG: response regulator [Lachnospiraceae bacterium]|nr:response regulator [Lachnospiraceae bacterium]
MFVIKIFRKYILNNELEVSHRLMNIILMAGLFFLPVCLIFDFILGSAHESVIPLALLFITYSLSFYLANVKDRANLAGIIMNVAATDFIIPYLYFMDGGKNSSMASWFIISALFGWLLVKGWQCYVLYIINVIVIGVVFAIEYFHPEYVTYLPDAKAEYFDMACGLYLIILLIGMIFKFQNRLYEKKKNELEEKETELTEANKRLEQLSEAKSMFLANMSHEIRTPINSITGMNEMVLRESNDGNIKGYAENIDHACATLLSLVNDILDFSKIEAGLMEIIPEEYELFSLLNDCYTLLQMRAKDKGLNLEMINDPDIPSRLYGDEVRIKQILVNLLTNAVKYTEKGSITMKVSGEESPENDMMILSVCVSDTGQGISEEGQQHLFDSYARIDEKRNRYIEGTGLGLAITKQLVDLMNATITVDSAPGKGSAFTVKIPQKIVSKEPMGSFYEKRKNRNRKAAGHRVSFTAENARILATDDVDMNLTVITLLLKGTKVQIDTAVSGAECLEKYEKEHYDILLLDHMMPEMDGIETLKLLKETERYKKEHTPVIVLTANAMLGAEKTYLDAGFDDYLTKPVKGADLEAMILKHLPDDVEVMVNEGGDDPV